MRDIRRKKYRVNWKRRNAAQANARSSSASTISVEVGGQIVLPGPKRSRKERKELRKKRMASESKLERRKKKIPFKSYAVDTEWWSDKEGTFDT